jgi:hypothetical protein
VTANGRLVVTFNEVGLAAAVAGLGLVSTTVGAAARKEISEGLVMRVLADWDMGEVELHAVFLRRIEWRNQRESPSVEIFSKPRVTSSRSSL